MNVYESVWSSMTYMNAYESIWMYMSQYDGIWK